MSNAAVEDELRPDNPAARLGKQLRLVLPPKARQENIKAMDREQLAVPDDGADRGTALRPAVS